MAAVADNRSFAVVYVPRGVRQITVDLPRVSGEGGAVVVTAYDPASGNALGRLKAGDGRFSAPDSHQGDWVLQIWGAKS